MATLLSAQPAGIYSAPTSCSSQGKARAFAIWRNICPPEKQLPVPAEAGTRLETSSSLRFSRGPQGNRPRPGAVCGVTAAGAKGKELRLSGPRAEISWWPLWPGAWTQLSHLLMGIMKAEVLLSGYLGLLVSCLPHQMHTPCISRQGAHGPHFPDEETKAQTCRLLPQVTCTSSPQGSSTPSVISPADYTEPIFKVGHFSFFFFS